MSRRIAIAALCALAAFAAGRAGAGPVLLSTTTDLGNGLFAYDLVLHGQDDEYLSFFAQDITFSGDLLGFSRWYDEADPLASYVYSPWTSNRMGAPIQSANQYQFSAGTGGGSKYLSLPLARVVVAGDLSVTGSIGRTGTRFSLSGIFSASAPSGLIESMAPPPPVIVDLPSEPPVEVPPMAPETPEEPDAPPIAPELPPPAPQPESPPPESPPQTPPTPDPTLEPGFMPLPPDGLQLVPIWTLPELEEITWFPNPYLLLGDPDDLQLHNEWNLETSELIQSGPHDVSGEFTTFWTQGSPRTDGVTSASAIQAGNELATPEPASWLLGAVGAIFIALPRLLRRRR